VRTSYSVLTQTQTVQYSLLHSTYSVLTQTQTVQYSLLHSTYSVLTQTQTVQYSLLHSTYSVLTQTQQYSIAHCTLRYMVQPIAARLQTGTACYCTVGNCNTVVSIVILYCNIMGLPSYMWSVVGRNVVMRRVTVLCKQNLGILNVRPLGTYIRVCIYIYIYIYVPLLLEWFICSRV
jgi:hypothetical protein